MHYNATDHHLKFYEFPLHSIVDVCVWFAVQAMQMFRELLTLALAVILSTKFTTYTSLECIKTCEKTD